MENNTNASKLLSNETSFTENIVNTSYWYTDEDINALLQVRIRNLGGFAANKIFLLAGIGQGNDYPEIGEEKRYQVLITQAVDRQSLLWFFDRTHQIAPDSGRPDDRRDIFAELAPLLAAPIANIKILFPYNSGAHWLLGEIKIHKFIDEFIINFYLHDPYRAGQWNFDNYQLLHQCFENKIYALQRGANVRVNNSPSHYISGRQNSNDTVSCGVIVVEDLIKRIAGNSLDIDRPYPSGAKELREQHIRQLENFYRREPNNPTLVNFKRRNIQQSFELDTQSDQKTSKIESSPSKRSQVKAISTANNESTSQLTSSVINLTEKENNHPEQISQNSRATHLILLRKQLLLEKIQALSNTINNQKAITPLLSSALIQQLTRYQAKLDTIDDTCIQTDTDEKSPHVIAAQEKIKSIRESLIRLRDNKIAKREKAYAEINEDILAWLKPALNELIGWSTLSRVKPGELPTTVEELHKTDLLRYQQNQANACSDFYQLLRTIHQLAKKDDNKKSVFISYAWPSPERKDYEDWVQDFLLLFKQHLENAHLRVLLDLTNSRNGYNSYRHMDEILECDYVILIGTESLLDKHQNNDTAGISAISTELNWIREKRIQDAEKGLYRVIPLIVSGDINQSIPIEYKRYTVIESFYSQGYTGTVVKLLGHILGYEKYQPFVNAYKTFQQQRPEYINQPSPFAKIEATIKPHIQQEPLEHKGQNYDVNIMQGKSTAFQSLQGKLKKIYREHAGEFKRLFDKKPHYIKEHYINLALIEQEKITTKENKTEENRLNDSNFNNRITPELDYSIPGLQHSIDRKNSSTPIELEALFTTCNPQEDLYHLAIYGGAGVGKSTLCQAIAYKWATDETFWQDQFSAIFWIKLRDLVDPKLSELKTAAELIAYICFDKYEPASALQSKEVKLLKQLMSNPSKAKPFLLILDGYDELPQQLWQTMGNQKRLQSPIDKLFLHSHVIVTSRPQGEIPFNHQQTLEILGLQPDQIQSYVDKFFGQNEVSKNKLKQYLEQNSILNNLAQIPLNLELICSIWKDEKNLSEQLTLTQLYEKLVHFIIKRYIENHTPEKTTLGLSSQALEKKIEQHYGNWLYNLEKLAWDMFGGNTTDSENTDIQIYCDTRNFIKLFDEQDPQYLNKLDLLLVECGLLRPVAGKEGCDDRQGEFIHLTFQEFFAARYAAKVIRNAHSQGDTDYEAFQTFFKNNKFNPKLQVVWWFIAGLLKNDSKALDRYFYILLQEPRDILLVNELPLFMHCLEQSNLGENSQIGKKVAEATNNNVLKVIRTKNSEFIKIRKTLKVLLALCPKFLQQKTLPLLVALLNESDTSEEKCIFTDVIFSLSEKVTTEKVFEKLLGLLSDEDEFVRLKAVRALASMGEKVITEEVIEKLLGLLDDEYLRTELAEVLIKFGKRTATIKIIKKLIELINTADEEVLSYAFEVLEAIDESSATMIIIQKIREGLNNIDSAVRHEAVNELSVYSKKVATKEVVEILLELLCDVDSYVRCKALEALGQLSEEAAKNDNIEKIIKMLDDTDANVRYEAVEVLRQLAEKIETIKVIEKIMGMLDDTDSNVKRKAVETLGELGKKIKTIEVIEKIMGMLDDTDFYVKQKAVQALGELGEKAKTTEVIEKIMGMLDDTDFYVKQKAVEALGKLGGKAKTTEVIEKIIKMLDDIDLDVQDKAVAALRQLAEKTKTTEVIEKIIRILDDPNPGVRIRAIDVLMGLSEKVTVKEITKKIMKMLDDSDELVRTTATMFLVFIAKKNEVKVVEQLVKMLMHEKKQIKEIALISLEHLGAKVAIPLLIRKLLQLLDDESVRFQVLKTLGQMGEKAASEQVIQKLMDLLDNTNIELSCGAAEALSQLGTKVATEQLIKKLLKQLFIADNYVGLIHWLDENYKYPRERFKDVLIAISKKTGAEKFFKIVIDYMIINTEENNCIDVRLMWKFFYFLKEVNCEKRLVLLSIMVSSKFEYFYPYLFDLFENISLTLKNDQLIWYEPGQARVTITLSAFNVQFLIETFYSNLKKFYGLEPSFVSQSLYVESEILQALSRGDLSFIETTLTNDASLINLLTENNESLISYVFKLTIHEAFQVQKLVLFHRPFVSLEHLNHILENNFLLHYQDNRESKKQNCELIEKTIISMIGTLNVNQKMDSNRLQVLSYALDMNLDVQLHPVRGLFAEDYLLFRLAYYLQLLGKLVSGTIRSNQYPQGFDKKTLSKSALITLIKREILLVWEALRLHDEWQCITYPSQNYSEGQIVQLWNCHAVSLINKLKALSDGEELIYPTGYQGHCIYVVFIRLADKIIGRVDNLLEADIQSLHQRNGKNYKPFLLGEWQVNEQLGGNRCSLKRYLTEGLFLAKSRGRAEALKLIYLQTPQENNQTLTRWSSLSLQSGDNCVVKGFQLGLLCRSVSDDIFNFLEEEHVSLWAQAIINPIPINNDSSSSFSISSSNNHNQRAMGFTIENTQNEPVLSHDALMDLLAEALNIPKREVKFGSTVEQTLVDIAGIDVKQNDPKFRRNHQDQSTMFYLNFPNEQTKQQFISFYQSRCPGIILRTIEESGKTRIDFDTSLFVQNIIPLLKPRRVNQMNSVLPTVYSSPISQPTHTNTVSTNNNNQPQIIEVCAEDVINVEPEIETEESWCLIM